MNTKAETNHTPGPWILQTGENDIFVEVVDSATEGVVLATLPADEQGYANARLIAAAPELLEALRLDEASRLGADKALSAFRAAGYKGKAGDGAEMTLFLREYKRAAIAKAQGTKS